MKQGTLGILAGLSLAAACGVAHATFSYAFVFGDPTSDVTKVASTAFQNGAMYLTSDADQHGALWYNTKQKVDTGFETTFSFRIQGGPTTQIPGDGFAFVLQDDPNGATAIGGGGSTLGYAGGDVGGTYYDLTRGVAIEFDTFGFEGEFPTPHVSIQAPNDYSDAASLAHASLADLGIDILDGQDHTAAIQYVAPDGVHPGALSVYIDYVFVCSATIDLHNIGGDDFTDVDGNMYVGFTAATGLADSVHIINDWAFVDDLSGCAAPSWHLIGWGGCGYGCGFSTNIRVFGSLPTQFQWFHNGVEITDNDGGRIQGLGTDTLRIFNPQPPDSGHYYCVVTNGCGTLTGLKVPLAPCIADLDDGSGTGVADGGIDINDLLFFLAMYEAGDLNADIDDGGGWGIGDFGVDINDLLMFLDHYEAGC